MILLQETAGIFSDYTSVLVLADFLYESGMYDKCMEIYEMTRKNRPDFDKFINQNSTTLYLAACAKQVWPGIFIR